MTIDDIKGKLFAVLNGKPANEKDVVYAFVKIRKVLEHAGQKKKYERLNLFCNWLLHVELDNPTVGDMG